MCLHTRGSRMRRFCRIHVHLCIHIHIYIHIVCIYIPVARVPIHVVCFTYPWLGAVESISIYAYIYAYIWIECMSECMSICTHIYIHIACVYIPVARVPDSAVESMAAALAIVISSSVCNVSLAVRPTRTRERLVRNLRHVCICMHVYVCLAQFFRFFLSIN